MILFVGSVHIFMFSLILYSRYFHFENYCWNHYNFRLKEEKVQAVGVSLSEIYALSEWHPLSEECSSLNVLGNPRRGSVRDVLAQRTASSPSELFVSSHAQHAQLAKPKFIYSHLTSLQNLKRQWAFETLKLAKTKEGRVKKQSQGRN